MRKKHYLQEHLFLIFLIMAVILSAIPVEILLGSFSKEKLFFTVLFLVLVWGAFLLYYRYLKGQGFGKTEMEPYRIQSDAATLKEVEGRLTRYFWEPAARFEELSAFSVYDAKKGLKLRISVFYFDEFQKEEFKQAKKKVNGNLNKLFGTENKVSRNEIGKNIRVNFIVVEKMTDDAEKLVHQNGDHLSGRVEPILNAVYDLSKKELLIPAHFGTANYLRYHKLYRMLEKCFLSE